MLKIERSSISDNLQLCKDSLRFQRTLLSKPIHSRMGFISNQECQDSIISLQKEVVVLTLALKGFDTCKGQLINIEV